MAKGIVGDIVHCVGVRYRVRGDGLLRTRLKNMDDVRTVTLDSVTMVNPSNRERTVISNFQDQGVQVFFRTTGIDDVLNITKIVAFVKPVAESYPIKSGG